MKRAKWDGPRKPIADPFDWLPPAPPRLVSRCLKPKPLPGRQRPKLKPIKGGG